MKTWPATKIELTNRVTNSLTHWLFYNKTSLRDVVAVVDWTKSLHMNSNGTPAAAKRVSLTFISEIKNIFLTFPTIFFF